jgi:hypothetical protein
MTDQPAEHRPDDEPKDAVVPYRYLRRSDPHEQSR